MVSIKLIKMRKYINIGLCPTLQNENTTPHTKNSKKNLVQRIKKDNRKR